MIDEPVHALSIGSVEGGSSQYAATWREALTRLTQRVADFRQDVTSPLNLNVVFQVQGNILRPDFEGVRTGKFSKKHRLLMVQVALSEQPPNDVDAHLKDKLISAVDKAEQWARERGAAEDLTQTRRLVMSL